MNIPDSLHLNLGIFRGESGDILEASLLQIDFLQRSGNKQYLIIYILHDDDTCSQLHDKGSQLDVLRSSL